MNKLNYVFTKRRLSVFEELPEDDRASLESNDAIDQLSLSSKPMIGHLSTPTPATEAVLKKTCRKSKGTMV